MKNGKMVVCKCCGAEIAKSAKVCPNCGARRGRKWWQIVLGIIILISGIGTLAGSFGDYTASSPSATVKPDTTISMSEFERIETGMTYDEVVEIVGTDGELSTSVDMFGSELKTEMYVWRGNGSIGSNANVTFQGGTVVAKSQVGLK